MKMTLEDAQRIIDEMRQEVHERDKSNEIAQAALKVAAKQIGLSYKKVVKAFTNWDDPNCDKVTGLFWAEIEKQGHDYTSVDKCPCCDKFWMGYDTEEQE